MPKRIQRKRTKGWRMPSNAIYVGRPSRFGNPCHVGMFRDYTHEQAVADHAKWLKRDPSAPWYALTPPTTKEIRAALRGKDLACWCPVGKPCHADTLLKIANGN